MANLQSESQSVAVVGGGLSGLTAANQLIKAFPHCKVTVLEAMSEVGGRTQTIRLQGCSFDLGAEFIGPTQKHVIDLAMESKNELVSVDSKGKKIIQFKKVISTYKSNIPTNVNVIALIQMQTMIWKINRMAKKVPISSPKDCPMGPYWDSMTVQSWIDTHIWFDKLKVMLEGAIRVILGVELSEVSFLYFLWYIHQNKDFDNLINVENGLQEKKTALGTQHFSLYLAGEIKKRGGSVITSYFVKSIFQNEGKCVLVSRENEQLKADFIVIAMPPANVRSIGFSPPLSEQRQLLCDRALMGTLIKVILLYERRYWKEKGFSGESLSDCFDSPVMNGFDDSRINEKGELQPALIIFIGGAIYRYWKHREDFQSVLTRKLAEYYDQPKMLSPTVIEWKAWDEESSVKGGPVGVFPPGVLSQVDDIRAPQGKIHWAGTQLASESTGFMDGAIESGKRVAREIISRLKGEPIQSKAPSQKQTQAFPYTKPIRQKRAFFEWL